MLFGFYSQEEVDQILRVEKKQAYGRGWAKRDRSAKKELIDSKRDTRALQLEIIRLRKKLAFLN